MLDNLKPMIACFADEAASGDSTAFGLLKDVTSADTLDALHLMINAENFVCTFGPTLLFRLSLPLPPILIHSLLQGAHNYASFITSSVPPSNTL